MASLSVVLPAYNEANTIERAVREVRRVLNPSDEILVVDDGSKDATASIVERLQANDAFLQLLRHPVNRGKGMAVRTGWQAATGDVLAFLDCDLSVEPVAIKQSLPLLTNADVVIGSRRVSGSHISLPQSPLRNLAGQMFNSFVRWYLDIPWKDTQCGFKLISRRALNTISPFIHARGWAFDVELLLLAQGHNYRVVEFPVQWKNRDDSRVRWTDAYAIYAEVRQLKKRLRGAGT